MFNLTATLILVVLITCLTYKTAIWVYVMNHKDDIRKTLLIQYKSKLDGIDFTSKIHANVMIIGISILAILIIHL